MTTSNRSKPNRKKAAKAKKKATKKKTSGRRTTVAKNKRREIAWMQVSDLLLDSQNPRLPEIFRDATQSELTKVLARDYGLVEIGQSLIDNGYFAEEPLVAIPDEESKKFVVVEGNRRLAALKLLVDSELPEKLNLKRWRELARENRRKLDQVPVMVYEHREQIIPYLGFRHIAGVLKWEPVSKARFIAQLVDQGKDFSEVAREIGSKAPTVRNNYVAYKLLRQAEASFDVNVENAENSFSILHRALNSPAIRKYVGINLDKPPSKLRKPVPQSKSGHTRELLSWMFGDEDNSAALSDSRQIDELAEVLDDESAIKELKVSRDLARAFRRVGGEARRLIDNLYSASYYLDSGLPDAHRHKRNKTVRELVERCNETMREYIRHFPDVESDD